MHRVVLHSRASGRSAVLKPWIALCASCRASSTSGPSRSPHEVLGIARGASTQEVKRAFLERAKELHPDKNTAPDAQLQFQRLQHAYEALTSPGSAGQSFGSYQTRAAWSHQSEASSWEQRARHGDAWYYAEQRRRQGTSQGNFGQRIAFRFFSMWPLWILLGLLLPWLRVREEAVLARHAHLAASVYHDKWGRAWVRDRSGVDHRVPGYDQRD